jgi:septum formation protein
VTPPPAAAASRLLLASASPRRRELLALLGVRFTVVVSRFDEAALAASVSDPVDYVRRAAEGKADDVARRRAGIVLGVDTDVVAPDGSILGKPRDAADAERMLRLLSGATHTVYSAVALVVSEGPRGAAGTASPAHRDVRVVGTRVTFGDLGDAAIRAYVATGEPRDKAGAYAIQGGALPFVTRVDGDLSNVIGLPLWTTAEMLAAAGVPLWENPDAGGHDAPSRTPDDA